MEIEVELADMPTMADNTMIIKYIIKNMAARDGKTATFLPKPIYKEAGNGLHVHMLLKKDGSPVFYDENGYSGLSQTAHYFIGGLLSHIASAYAKSPETKRFELRNPDATANPYYAYAAILMAGLDGIEKKIDPAANGWGPYDFNLYTLSPEEQKKIKGLPKSLDEALDALEKDHDYLTKDGVFPERLINVWIERKRAESKEAGQIPTPAEFMMYYDL